MQKGRDLCRGDDYKIGRSHWIDSVQVCVKAMYSPLVIWSLLVFLLVLCLPADAGDCYEDKDYSNCVTCYETFANALVNTANNMYSISRAFFPVDNVSPVQVEVTYLSNSTKDDRRKYFWVLGGFFVYQPVTVFLYRSLFFSSPSYRRESVIVVLPDPCFNTTTQTDKFFEYTTQRLKGYAQSQSAIPDVDSTYIGMATREDDGELKYNLEKTGDAFIAATYGIAFIVFLVALIIIFIAVWLTDLLETAVKTIEEHPYQANVAATVLLCCVITLYTFILDIISLSLSDVPEYFYRRKDFFGVQIACLIIYFLMLLVGIVWLVIEVVLIYMDNHKETFVRSRRIALIFILIAGSTVLSLAAHLPSILMAWATNPFYASKIALFYCITIFSYFTAFHYSYIIGKKAFDSTKGSEEEKFNWKACVLVTILLIVSFVFVSLLISFMSVLVITVPVNNSIETVSEGVTTIYNGAVVLIGALLAYRIGWYYFGHSFSISGALKNAMESILSFPDNPKWLELTEEGRLTAIVKTIIESDELHKVLRKSSPPKKEEET